MPMRSRSRRPIRTDSVGAAVDGSDDRLGHVMQQRHRMMHALLARPAVEADFAGGRIPMRRCMPDTSPPAQNPLPLPVNTSADLSAGGYVLERMSKLGALVVADRVAAWAKVAITSV